MDKWPFEKGKPLETMGRKVSGPTLRVAELPKGQVEPRTEWCAGKMLKVSSGTLGIFILKMITQIEKADYTD